MKNLLNRIAERRARALAQRVRPHLPASGRLLDIGSGTGHNAVALRQSTELELVEADVVDMSVVGNGPVVFDGRRLPFAGDAFSASLMMFILQYPRDPVELLTEARRVTHGRVVVLQSTYRGLMGLALLSMREFVLGRFAFAVARWVRFVKASPCPLRPHSYFTQEGFRELARRSGLEVKHVDTSRPFGLPVCRDLFVLEPLELQ
ncbi:MAG: methyltransferase domain-containing protein [Pirellulales bacterium]